jgi:hypothetical protein
MKIAAKTCIALKELGMRDAAFKNLDFGVEGGLCSACGAIQRGYYRHPRTTFICLRSVEGKQRETVQMSLMHQNKQTYDGTSSRERRRVSVQRQASYRPSTNDRLSQSSVRPDKRRISAGEAHMARSRLVDDEESDSGCSL